MASSWSEITKVKYSPNGIKLLGFLPKGGKPIASAAVVSLLYGDPPPIHGRQSIVAAMATLIRKVELNREDYIITRTAPSGPNPTLYKKEKRK